MELKNGSEDMERASMTGPFQKFAKGKGTEGWSGGRRQASVFLGKRQCRGKGVRCRRGGH